MSWAASKFVNFYYLMHISTSFNNVLKTSMALAEYPHLRILNFWLMDFSKLLSHKLLAVHHEGSILAHCFNSLVRSQARSNAYIRPPSASLSVSFPDVSVSVLPDSSKDTGCGAK